MPAQMTETEILLDIFHAAVRSALPDQRLLERLPEKPKGRCIVVGAGKASALMAATLDRAWQDVDLSGVVTTRYGHAEDADRVEVIEAGHPVPDAHSILAAERILGAVTGLTADDLVIALISGGGSANLCLPIDGLSLTEKQRITGALLSCGAAIEEINTVRKHLSKVKGGKVAALAQPARVHSLLVSDIPGDDPSAIASGPTVQDITTPQEALDILNRYRIDVAPVVRRAVRANTSPNLSGFTHDIIVRPSHAMEAAADRVRALGLSPVILGDGLEGESREMAKVIAGMAKSVKYLGHPAEKPVVLISGGESTVSLNGGNGGRGGRNTEFALASALALKEEEGIWTLACDSDGIDGTEDAAGAIVSPDTVLRAKAKGLDPADYLKRHDSYSFFAALDDLVITGPTKTNVNDIRLALVR